MMNNKDKKFRGLLFATLIMCLSTALSQPLSAQPPMALRSTQQRQNDIEVSTRLRAKGDCKRAKYLTVCIEAEQLSKEEFSAFFEIAHAGANNLRLVLGENLDIPGGNENAVEIFVAKQSGYAHTTGHFKPWLFIPPEAIKRGQAPYLHEMVHVMAQWSWRKSEWFAEGFANYIAAQVVREHGGYHRSFVLSNGLDDLPQLYRSEAGKEMLPLLQIWGRRSSYQGAPLKLFERLQTKRPTYAPPYYAMSWSFTGFLVEKLGVGSMREVVESDQPATVLKRKAGSDLAQLVREWRKTLD